MRATERQGLKILLLEDDLRDAELIRHVLQQQDPAVTVLAIDGRAAMIGALEEFAPDAVVADNSAPSMTALDALCLLQMHRPTVPLVLVSGTMGQTVTRCLKAGAADFVPKTELARLESAIRTALEVRAPLRRLSQRQCHVLQRLAAGQSTRGIAETLGISIKTVETHRAELMKRLGIHDLAGLVRYAVVVGLVTASD
jgi:DNA-binding NarL/FixJ family response regulator